MRKKIQARRPDCIQNHYADDRFLPHDEAMRVQKEKGAEAPFANLARPERFELPTTKFVAWYSIQLSYGREEAELLRLKAISSTLNVRLEGSVRHATGTKRLVCSAISANALFDPRLPSRYPSRPRNDPRFSD